MRKNVIALMLVLPLLFVFVVFSAVNAASLDVQISANGIEILERYPGDTISVDLADYKNDYEITPKVQPANASNRDFTYRYEKLSGKASEEEVAAGKVVEVVEGKIVAKAVGTVRIIAVSNDGGYEDGLTVIVGSSKPYAFTFSFYRNGAGAESNLLTEWEGDSASASVQTGLYSYSTKLEPNGYLSPVIQQTSAEGFMEVDPAIGSILLPFSGTTSFDVNIEGGTQNGQEATLTKHVTIHTTRPAGALFTVNGGTNYAINYNKEEREASFYVEASSLPDITCADATGDILVEPVEGVENGYRVTIPLPEAEENETFHANVTVNGTTRTVDITSVTFSFEINSDLPVDTESNSVNILLNRPIAFYAVPNVAAGRGITYKWDVINADDERTIHLDFPGDGSVCTVTATARGSFILVAEAQRDGESIANIDAPEKHIEVVNYVSAIQFDNNTDVGLARSLAVGGQRYEGNEKVVNRYALNLRIFNFTETLGDGAYDLDFTSDNPASIADVLRDGNGEAVVEDGNVILDIKGSGTVTITASWKGNEDFLDPEEYVVTPITLIVNKDGVEVSTSNQLFQEAEAGNPIVLAGNIMLGTADDGTTPLSIAERRAMLHTMRSTYNTAYYTNIDPAAQPTVSYVVEFKNNVYGNGYTLNAELFTNAQDSTGKPEFFQGPLYLVNFGDLASVAAQDNIAFLCRTDGVTIYNAEILGCSDESLFTENGSADLTKLNNVGTVLEINADVNVLNCRIRNGRNVVRAFGGNRDGKGYFITALSENRVTEQDRIYVRIEGCILTQGREFLLKTGANRALQSGSRLGAEPAFTDRNGKAYASQTNNLLDDEYFKNSYVLTFVTLADSVLEKSGLFCIGVEANFAGEALNRDGQYSQTEYFKDWAGVGGTSFASILTLEGDVRLYDWKQLKLIDSSTLIESSTQELPMTLDIAAMIEYMRRKDPERFGDIIEDVEGEQYVHGGIALYGGGRNYSQVSLGGLTNGRGEGFNEYKINISELSDAEGDMGGIGQLLPLAAGKQDFRFYMYGASSPNDYGVWQKNANYSVSSVPCV